MTEALTFLSDCDDPSVAALTLQGAVGHEVLGALYQYRLELVSLQDQGLAPESIDAMLAAPCRVTVGEATLSGVLRRVTTLPALGSASGDEDGAYTAYQAELVPTAWRLTQTVRSRVFQEQTPMEVVQAVLTEHGLTFESALTETYPWREYIVQYEESDWAFVARLMEHWGVFVLFEQTPDSEKIVLADANAAFKPHDTWAALNFDVNAENTNASGPWKNDSGAARQATTHANGSGWTSLLRRVQEPRPAAVTLADYNWRAPFLDADGTMTARQLQLRPTHAADELTGQGGDRRYGDHFKDDAEGARLAQIRAEELLATRVLYDGQCRAPGLAAGHRLTTSGMPLADQEQEYVITEMLIGLDPDAEAGVAWQRWRAITSDTAFRPARRTRKPVIHGFMHAVIDGEVVSTAAPIDVLGRYRVVMPYDEAAAPGGRASRWIRMAQASAGSDYGVHLPLHIGTEVIVAHLLGDPDRPVIVGAVPNVDTVSPVVTDNATQSRIKTRGAILFELEDDA